MKVKAIQKGSAPWAQTLAIRVVAVKYESEVSAIARELMYAFADGFLEGLEDAKKSRK